MTQWLEEEEADLECQRNGFFDPNSFTATLKEPPPGYVRWGRVASGPYEGAPVYARPTGDIDPWEDPDGA